MHPAWSPLRGVEGLLMLESRLSATLNDAGTSAHDRPMRRGGCNPRAQGD